MKRIAFIVSLILLTVSITKMQEITDNDKRAFDELGQVKIDVDGDGKLDTIQPRTFQVISRRVKGKRIRKRFIQNWITFDLTTSRGRRTKSFFKYNYGDGEASYWVYVLKSAGDVNKDGKTDLVFYSGDDSSDETIILANKGTRFVVYKKIKTDSDEW
jgi:hypothetical protein